MIILIQIEGTRYQAALLSGELRRAGHAVLRPRPRITPQEITNLVAANESRNVFVVQQAQHGAADETAAMLLASAAHIVLRARLGKVGR